MELVSETDGDVLIRIFRQHKFNFKNDLKPILSVLQNFDTDHFQQIIFNYQYIIPHLQLFIDKNPWYLTKVYSNIPILQEKMRILNIPDTHLETAKQEMERVFLQNPRHLIRMPIKVILHLLSVDLFLTPPYLQFVLNKMTDWYDPQIVNMMNAANCIYHTKKYIKTKKEDLAIIISRKFPVEIIFHILKFVEIDTSELVFDLKEVITPDILVSRILHNEPIPFKYINRGDTIEIIVKPESSYT